MLAGVFAGTATALLLHGFYLLLRQSDKGRAAGVDYVDFRQAVNYRSIADFLATRNSNRWRFILFRTLPVMVALLLMIGTIEKGGHGTAPKWCALLVFVMLNVLFTLIPNRKLLPFISVRLIYWTFTVFNAVIGVIIVGLSFIWDFSGFSIEWSDLIDNLVAALLAAIIVVAWLKSTNMANRSSSSRENWELEKRGFIREKAELVLSRLGYRIRQVAEQYDLEPAFILAILTYEDLNRPQFIRRVENLLVRIPGLKLTVGIAQVRSSKPLSDEESIVHLGQILQDPALSPRQRPTWPAMKAALIRYNGDESYALNVFGVYLEMRALNV